MASYHGGYRRPAFVGSIPPPGTVGNRHVDRTVARVGAFRDGSTTFLGRRSVPSPGRLIPAVASCFADHLLPALPRRLGTVDQPRSAGFGVLLGRTSGLPRRPISLEGAPLESQVRENSSGSRWPRGPIGTAPSQRRARRSDGEWIYVILDNLSAHKGKKIRAWAERNKVELCFTPTYSSRAKPIETHFGPLRDFVLNNSNHPNHVVLTRRLHAHLRWRNANARAPELLAAQRRQRARIRAEKGRRWGRHDPPHEPPETPARTLLSGHQRPLDRKETCARGSVPVRTNQENTSIDPIRTSLSYPDSRDRTSTTS